jgi:hypothetical protein
VKCAALVFCGLVFAVTSFAQGAYVRWGNTSATSIFTNDCSGTIARISGNRTYRFGLYASSLGSPVESLRLVALATNNSAIPGLFGSPNATALIVGHPPGAALTFQVRGWSLFAGTNYEEAVLAATMNPAGGIYLGVSDVGYVVPGADVLNPPSIFGTGPGQIGGFELIAGVCRPLVSHHIAPDGPVKITRFTHDGITVWTNVLTSSATYKYRAASAITGPYANYTTVTAGTSEVTFTNPYSGPRLFFNIEWADAPLPQPIGTWDYQAFDPSGAVMVAGIFTFTSNVPITVTRNFSRIQSVNAAMIHPAGSGTLDAYSVGRSNVIELFYSSDFRLRGQMVSDYFAGDWFAVDHVIGIPEDPPPVSIVTYSGRFVARRR